MANRHVRVDWIGNHIAARAQSAAARGAEAGAEHVRDVSVRRAPVRTGALRNSARVATDPETGQSAVTFHAEHAVYQHERLDYQHDDGEPKFLERSLVSERDAVARIMQAEIRGALGSSWTADLAHGLAELLPATGIATYRPTGTYNNDETGLVVGVLP